MVSTEVFLPWWKPFITTCLYITYFCDWVFTFFYRILLHVYQQRFRKRGIKQFDVWPSKKYRQVEHWILFVFAIISLPYPKICSFLCYMIQIMKIISFSYCIFNIGFYSIYFFRSVSSLYFFRIFFTKHVLHYIYDKDYNLSML